MTPAEMVAGIEKPPRNKSLKRRLLKAAEKALARKKLAQEIAEKRKTVKR